MSSALIFKSIATKEKENMANMLLHIKKYASQGYATFPTVQRDKSPLLPTDWRETKIDHDPTAKKYSDFQFGVVLTATDLVVDLDPRNMGGERVWERFRKDFAISDSIEKGMCVITGSGGVHIYLKKPKDIIVRKTLKKKYPGIDFLTKGSYVIGAGSMHSSGKPYVLFNQSLDQSFNIIPAPVALLSAIAKTETVYDLAGAQGYRDEPDNQNRFVQYLQAQAPIACEGQMGDQTTFKVACRGRDFNLSPDMCFELMLKYYNDRCEPAWGANALKEKVRNAYAYNEVPAGKFDPVVALPEVVLPEDEPDNSWVGLLDRGPKMGVYKCTLKNAVLVLDNHPLVKGLFRINDFTDRWELAGLAPWECDRNNPYRQLNDREINHMSLWFNHAYGLDYTAAKLWQAVDIVASKQSYHPIRSYLDNLTWDGTPRVEKWLEHYAGVEPGSNDMRAYVRAVSKKVLVGAVARIYQPGVKFDQVLVLEGAQGIGKSTCCAILGGSWYGDAPLDLNDKDTIEYVHTHWIIELSELISVRKADINRLKNFISRTEDDIRKPYMRSRDKYPRQSVFIGTINPDEIGYLNDSENRRFWPVLCTKFKLNELKAHRDQLWAEAVQMYRNGETLYLNKDLAPIARETTSERQPGDPWADLILHWSDNNKHVTQTTTSEIFQNVVGGSFVNMSLTHQRRIATLLQKNGWIKCRNAAGFVYKRYHVIQEIRPEINKPKNPFAVSQLEGGVR